ncbi:MAG: GGDEF domain-containing protein [Rhodoferax sp.]|nr:GGDEF domain-containing protein [Rhodoferax sp.]
MSTLIDELAQTNLLRDVPETVLTFLSEHAAPRELVAGEILLCPEQENQYVYLLLSGSLSVHFDSPESPPIRELLQGVSVGEVSIIDDSNPSAYIIANQTSRVFPIHRDLIDLLVSEANPFARNLLRMLTHWLKANTQRIVRDRVQIWELTDQAQIDPLTGLYNRRWLDRALARLLIQARKGDLPLCILMVDVDHFKRYNDEQGHLGGDQALMAMSDVLKTTVRPYDFVTRYGGEEFLVLLPNTRANDGLIVAERIRQATEKKVVAYPDSKALAGMTATTPLPGITVSIGLAVSQCDSVAELIAAADAQLYRAKADGRNCVRH